MTKIICAKCKISKDESQFGRKNNKRLQSYCKPCLYEYQTKRWIDRKIWAISYKGGRCNKCNQEFPYYVMDFHHIDRTSKLYDWNKMRLVSMEKLKTELEKCILLCANCHRIVEFELLH